MEPLLILPGLGHLRIGRNPARFLPNHQTDSIGSTEFIANTSPKYKQACIIVLIYFSINQCLRGCQTHRKSDVGYFIWRLRLYRSLLSTRSSKLFMQRQHSPPCRHYRRGFDVPTMSARSWWKWKRHGGVFHLHPLTSGRRSAAR